MDTTQHQRATLLLGYGRFGLQTLRQFLVSTATRGVLAWDASDAAERGARQLRDLRLLCFRDPFEKSDSGAEPAGLYGSRAELLRDLHEQIEVLPDDPDEIKEIVIAKAGSLLNAARRAGRNRSLPLGLDVIVVVHAQDWRTLGKVRPYIKDHVIDCLDRSFTSLRREAGASALNFIHIVDFENYWQRSPSDETARKNFRDYVEAWQRRRQEAQPTFGRIYMVDSQTPNGVRSEQERIDEISLFLEFLLFEGQRDSETMQALYQARPEDQNLLATFGIRLLERSEGLLKRLAAARFGIGWLEYLTQEQCEVETGIQSLHDVLEALLGSTLKQSVEDRKLPMEAQKLLENLTQRLDALIPEEPEWPSQVATRSEQGMREIEIRLATRAQEHQREIFRNGPLADLAATLRATIDRVLHHDRRPATLGQVLKELRSYQSFAESALVESPDFVSAPTPNFQSLRQLHSRYRVFLEAQLDLNRATKWWVFFAFLIAIGTVPCFDLWIRAWLGQHFDPASASSTMRFTHEVANWLIGSADSLPPVPEHGWALLLAALVLGAAISYCLARGVKRKVLRARRFWSDLERGRLSDAQASLSEELAQIQKEWVERLHLDLASNVRNAASRELSQLLPQLAQRRREIDWLKSQLRDFLDMHGLTEQSPPDNWTRISRADGIRHALERSEDLERMLASNQLNAGRFQSMQAGKKPFADWNERYSSAFLYPLGFIDELSESYRGAEQDSESGHEYRQATEGSAHLLDFLKRHARDFSTAFRWKTQDGVPQDSVFCLLPSLWLNLPGVRETLTEQGVVEDHRLRGADPARAYLLRVKIGVDTSCLL